MRTTTEGTGYAVPFVFMDETGGYSTFRIVVGAFEYFQNPC